VEIKLKNNITRVNFREVHLTKRCPRCFAAVGSKCRRLDGTVITGTHTERARVVRDSEGEKVKKQ
jgi:hypothetical protein